MFITLKTVEQLENQVKTMLTNAEERFNTTISDEVGKLQNIGEEINEQQTEVLRKSEEKLKDIEETHNRYKNELAEIPIEQFKSLFGEQAEKHRKMSWVWLISTIGLTLIFGCVFWWLLSDIGSTTDRLQEILPNLIAKGFLFL